MNKTTGATRIQFLENGNSKDVVENPYGKNVVKKILEVLLQNMVEPTHTCRLELLRLIPPPLLEWEKKYIIKSCL